MKKSDRIEQLEKQLMKANVLIENQRYALETITRKLEAMVAPEPERPYNKPYYNVNGDVYDYDAA